MLFYGGEDHDQGNSYIITMAGSMRQADTLGAASRSTGSRKERDTGPGVSI